MSSNFFGYVADSQHYILYNPNIGTIRQRVPLETVSCDARIGPLPVVCFYCWSLGGSSSKSGIRLVHDVNNTLGKQASL